MTTEVRELSEEARYAALSARVQAVFAHGTTSSTQGSDS